MPDEQPPVFHPVRARYIGERRHLRSIDRHVHRTHQDAEGNPVDTVRLAAGHTLDESAHNVWGYTALIHVNADEDHPQQPPVILGLGIRLVPDHEATGLTPYDVLGRTFWHDDGTARQYEFHEARTDMEPVEADPTVARNLVEWVKQRTAEPEPTADEVPDDQATQTPPASRSRRAAAPAGPSEGAPAAEPEQGTGE